MSFDLELIGELDYIRDRENVKSTIAKDILCGLGFCLCQKKYPYRFCQSYPTKINKVVFFDERIPQRYRTSKYITERQFPKNPEFNKGTIYTSSDSECLIKHDKSKKSSFIDDFKFEKKVLKKGRIRTKTCSKPSTETFLKSSFTKKVFVKQNAKQGSELYVPVMSKRVSPWEEELRRSELKRQLTSYFILPDPDISLSTTSFETATNEINPSNNNSESYNPYILPQNPTRSESVFSYPTVQVTFDDDIYEGKKSSDDISQCSLASESEANTSICSKCNQYIGFNNKIPSITSIENKLNLIINEIRDLKLTVNNLVRVETNVKTRLSDIEIQNYKVEKSPENIRYLRVNTKEAINENILNK